MLNWFWFEYRHTWRKYRQQWLQLLLCSMLLAMTLLTLALFSGTARFLQASIPAGLDPDRQYFTLAGQTQDLQPALFALAHADKITSSALRDQVAFYQSVTASSFVQGVEHQASRIALVSPNFFQLLQPQLLSGVAFNQHNHLQQAVVSARFWQQLNAERTVQVHGKSFQISGVLDPTFCAPDLREFCPDIWLSNQNQYLFLPASVLYKAADQSTAAAQKALLTRQAFAQIKPAYHAFGVIAKEQSLQQIRQSLTELPIYSQTGQITYQGKTVSASAYAALQQITVVSGLTNSPDSRLQQLQLLQLILVVAVLMSFFALLSLFLLIANQWQQHQAEFHLRLVLGMSAQAALRLLLTELSLLSLVLLCLLLLCWWPVNSYLTALPVLGTVFASYQQQLGWLDLVWLLALLVCSMLLLCMVLTLNIRRQLHQQQQHQKPQNTALQLSLSLSLALLLTLAPAVLLLRLDLARMQSTATVGTTHQIYSLAYTGAFDPAKLPDAAQRTPLFNSVGIKAELALYLPLQGRPQQQAFRLTETAGNGVNAAFNPVSPGFYELLNIELQYGNLPQHAGEVVLSATLARQLAEPSALIGKLLLTDGDTAEKIVGIVSDVHYTDPYGKADAVVYAPASAAPDYLYQHIFQATPPQLKLLQQKLQQPAYANLTLSSQQELNQKQHQNFQSLIEVLSFTAVLLSLVLLVIFYYGMQRLLAAKGKESLLLLALGCPLWQLPARQLTQLQWPLLLALPTASLLLWQLPVSLNQLQQQSWLWLLLVLLLLALLTLTAIALPLLQQLRQPLSLLLGEQKR